MALNPLIDAVRHELSCHEFIIVVRVKHPELATTLLRSYLLALDGARSCCLKIEQHGPHIAGGIIDE